MTAFVNCRIGLNAITHATGEPLRSQTPFTTKNMGVRRSLLAVYTSSSDTTVTDGVRSVNIFANVTHSNAASRSVIKRLYHSLASVARAGILLYHNFLHFHFLHVFPIFSYPVDRVLERNSRTIVIRTLGPSNRSKLQQARARQTETSSNRLHIHCVWHTT